MAQPVSELCERRSCLLCSLIKSMKLFDGGNCINCEKILMVRNDIERVHDCKSPNGRVKDTKNAFETEVLEKNISQVISSFTDRVYNFHGSTIDNDAQHCKSVVSSFETALFEGITNFLRSADSSTTLDLCARIVSDYSLFITKLVNWIIENSLNFDPLNIFVNPVNYLKKQQQLIVQLLSCVHNGTQLKKIFGRSIFSNMLIKRVFMKQLLCSQNVRKIIQYLHMLNDNVLTLEMFLHLFRLFVDQSGCLQAVAFEHLVQTATALLYTGRILRADNLSEELRCEVNTCLSTVVPEYLKLADNCRRQIGMFVGETLTNLFVIEEKSRLVFEYSDNLILNGLRLIVVDRLDEDIHPQYKDCSNVQRLTIKEKIEIQSQTKSRKLIDSRTQLLDSDDEEDESNVEEKSFIEEIREHEAGVGNCPVYLRNCLESLSSEKENFKNFAVSLRALPRLICRRAVGFDDLAQEILDQMICLEDRFHLPDFNKLREESAALTIAYRPELVSHAIRVFYSNQCSMTNRFFILSCVCSAARLLSGEKLKETDDFAGSKIEVVDKNAADKLDNDGRGHIDEHATTSERHLGRIVWRSRELERPADVSRAKNDFLTMAPQFIYPLLDVRCVGAHLDLYDRDHQLLGKLLATAAQLLYRARNSSAIIQIISHAFTFLRPLRGNPHSFVLSGLLLCYAAIIDSLPPVVDMLFAAEVNECAEWLCTLADQRHRLEADPTLEKMLALTAIKVNLLVGGDKPNEGKTI